MTMQKQHLRILCPNRPLGFLPFQETGFWIGAESRPDYYCCTSGNPNVGPDPLGNDISVSPYEWQKHHLELLLLASRKQGVPLLIGSSGDTGANSRVDLFVNMVKHLALKHALSAFKIVYFYSEIKKERLRGKLEQGVIIDGLDNRPSLTTEDLDQTDRIVAIAGIDPFLKALDMGADVIIGGRSRTEAIFASAAIYEGFPEPVAYHLGRELADASQHADISSGSQTVIGKLTNTGVKVMTMQPQQNYRETSIAASSLCEPNPSLPDFQNMPDLTIREVGTPHIQLEGVGKIGERCIGIVHLNSSTSLTHLNTKIDLVRQELKKSFSGKPYQFLCNVRQPLASSLCIVMEGIAETEHMAEEMTVFAARSLFALKNLDFSPELTTILSAPAAYRWTIRHILAVDDPLELFEMHELLVE